MEREKPKETVRESIDKVDQEVKAVQITHVEIDLGSGDPLRLTVPQAKALMEQLQKLFEVKVVQGPPGPPGNPRPITPDPWMPPRFPPRDRNPPPYRPHWGDIWCRGGTAYLTVAKDRK